MATTLPGTTVEVSRITPGLSRRLFDGMFAGGGVTLCQVATLTGLEPSAIQNWVKRGFVSSPVRRQYTRNQLSRIVIINLLREALQIEQIREMLSYLNGHLTDESDDIISDSELYHIYVDMLARYGGVPPAPAAIAGAAREATAGYVEPVPGAARRLVKTLEIMAYAHAAAAARRTAEETLAQLG